MFYLAAAFNQNIAAWNTASVTSMVVFTGSFGFDEFFGIYELYIRTRVTQGGSLVGPVPYYEVP
jgi:surface protein